MFSVELKDQAVTAALMRLAAATADPKPVMDAIGELLLVSTQDRLKAGKSPDGSAFAPRSAATLARYEKKKLSYGLPLYQSGEMYNQMNYEAGSDFVEVGTTPVQSAMMHFGGTKAQHPNLWGNIPARPFLGISETDSADIVAEIAEWLTGIIQA